MTRTLLCLLLTLVFNFCTHAQNVEAGLTAGYATDIPVADYHMGGALRIYGDAKFIQAGFGLEQRSFNLNPELFLNLKTTNRRRYVYGGGVVAFHKQYISRGIQMGGVYFLKKWIGISAEYTYRYNTYRGSNFISSRYSQSPFTYHCFSLGVRFAF